MRSKTRSKIRRELSELARRPTGRPSSPSKSPCRKLATEFQRDKNSSRRMVIGTETRPIASRNLTKALDTFDTVLPRLLLLLLLMRRISMSVAARTGRTVDALDDHVKTIQAATADLERLRFHRVLETCGSTRKNNRIR